LSRAL
jgi:hypothetical protein